MKIWSGTSGYSYKEWKGSFYPDDIKPPEMLEFYAGVLPAVEINNTFYRLPKASVLETWAGQVGDDFRFSIKASRRITHMKRLKEAQDETQYLLDTVQTLGPRLGVVLYQLPPNFKKDMDRLTSFLDLLDGETRAVFEFRHESWLADEVHELLRERSCALCIADVDDEPEPELIKTTDWGYMRLRRTDYSETALKSWFDRIHKAGWSEAFVFFKHEDGATGPRLASRLLELSAGS